MMYFVDVGRVKLKNKTKMPVSRGKYYEWENVKTVPAELLSFTCKTNTLKSNSARASHLDFISSVLLTLDVL